MKAPHELREIAGWLAATDIALLELRMPGGVVRLGWRNGAVKVLGDDEAPLAAADTFTVTAPSVGVFLTAHPVDRGTAVPLARVGGRVEAGQALGLLQVGVLLLPVVAPRAGIVAALRARTGATVGYGTPLVDLRPL